MPTPKVITLAELIDNTQISELPEMPIVKDPSTTTLNVVEQAPEALQSILTAGADGVSPAMLKFLDKFYARKINKGNVPFGSEILDIAQYAGGIAGAIALNFCPDIACSTGIYTTKEGNPSLVRTLDWGLKMAATTTGLTRAGQGGNWFDISYPGFAGSVTAMAPHFAAAINRAPMPMRYKKPLDASTPNYKPPALERVSSFLQTIKSHDISTAHLLRQTFEECTAFDDAVHKIATTKTNSPVIITIAGTKADEAAIIYKDNDYCAISTFPEGFDRLTSLFESTAHVQVFEEDNLAAANHWPADYGLRPAHQRRYTNSEARAANLVEALKHAQGSDIFGHLEVSKTDVDGRNIVSSTALVAELTPATKTVRAVAMEDQHLVLKPATFCLSQ